MSLLLTFFVAFYGTIKNYARVCSCKAFLILALYRSSFLQQKNGLMVAA